MENPVSGIGPNLNVPREDVTEKLIFWKQLNEMKEKDFGVSWRRNVGRESWQEELSGEGEMEKNLEPITARNTEGSGQNDWKKSEQKMRWKGNVIQIQIM